jgi:hypothetical protein
MVQSIHTLDRLEIALFLRDNWHRLSKSIRARLHNEIF